MTRNPFSVPGGLYAILDESIVTDGDWSTAASKLLDGGAKVIQLRAKTIDAGDMLQAALAISDKCKSFDATFIVNDRVDVALIADADGVHVGQEDIPVHACRKLLGPRSIIGLSTHSMEEAVAAGTEVDYIGFGPIYQTGTKVTGRQPHGPEKLAEIVNKVDLPVVAIGGINAENIVEVKKTGACAGAVISALGSSGDLEQGVKNIISVWGHA